MFWIDLDREKSLSFCQKITRNFSFDRLHHHRFQSVLEERSCSGSCCFCRHIIVIQILDYYMTDSFMAEVISQRHNFAFSDFSRQHHSTRKNKCQRSFMVDRLTLVRMETRKLSRWMMIQIQIHIHSLLSLMCFIISFSDFRIVVIDNIDDIQIYFYTPAWWRRQESWNRVRIAFIAFVFYSFSCR